MPWGLVRLRLFARRLRLRVLPQPQTGWASWQWRPGDYVQGDVVVAAPEPHEANNQSTFGLVKISPPALLRSACTHVLPQQRQHMLS